ncbi:uncharacterized protein [Prorops nasuta]|uniref:uncharacterized protein n=1 Tax=Prorops nasuta TaxID=863751 RepID=UPI0034CE0540
MENLPILFPVVMSQNFNDSSSSDDEQRIPKVDKYAEETIPKMYDNQFKAHFRMSKTVFEILINMAEEIIRRNPVLVSGFPEINLKKEFLITIWYLANLESLRSVSERFGVAKSTCWSILYRTCNILAKVNQSFGIIKWPDEERQLQIKQGFSRRNFDGVIGCIDGSHIRIRRPKYNDIYVGEAGSLHDNTLYKKSNIYKQITNGKAKFCNDTYLLGDLAYKLSSNLLVGFKDNGHLSNRQKQFNKALSKIRRIPSHNSYIFCDNTEDGNGDVHGNDNGVYDDDGDEDADVMHSRKNDF